jgi:hypothetical protein
MWGWFRAEMARASRSNRWVNSALTILMATLRPKRGVAGLVYYAHAALAEFPGDFVVRDGAADHASIPEIQIFLPSDKSLLSAVDRGNRYRKVLDCGRICGLSFHWAGDAVPRRSTFRDAGLSARTRPIYPAAPAVNP